MAAAALPASLEAIDSARQSHARGQLLQAAETYRQALLDSPGNQPALLGLSLIARQSGQLEPALHMAQAAVAAYAGSALAWANFGDALIALGHADAAQSAFRRALSLDSALAPAHYGLGNILGRQDDFRGALASFTRAIELAPHSAECHFAAAFAHGRLGQHREAIGAYRHAVRLRPDFASAWLNLGVELVADGRDHLAAPCYRQALAAALKRPDTQSTSLSAYLNLGHLARGRRNFELAQAHYESALSLARCNPRLSEVHVAFTYLHLEQRQFPQAWRSLREAEAIDLERANLEIPNARGILLLAEDAGGPVDGFAGESSFTLIDEAIAAFGEAESEGHKTAGSNCGNALLRVGRVTEALAAHEASLERDPHHPGVRYNLALTQLRAGDFAEGWRNYEVRWLFREVHPRPRQFRQPRWLGEDLSRLCNPEINDSGMENSRLASLESPALFLYAEQGLGDALQFFRYLPLVAERLPGVPLIFEVQPPLMRLLAGNLAGLPVQLIAHGDPVPRFTHHCPLMSLPAVFKTTLETVPGAVPYLHTVEVGEGKLPERSAGLLTVGLNWAGNPRYRADRERSTRLETFSPLLSLPEVRWISLQKGEPARQIAQLPARFLASLDFSDACSEDRDLAATAAVIASLDLVITTDTAIAHLAGALGKPLWLLLPWQSDWRWMQQIATTPWYPTARLWRQSSPGNWAELIGRIRDELAGCKRCGLYLIESGC